jgi:hypothetical protein
VRAAAASARSHTRRGGRSRPRRTCAPAHSIGLGRAALRRSANAMRHSLRGSVPLPSPARRRDTALYIQVRWQYSEAGPGRRSWAHHQGRPSRTACHTNQPPAISSSPASAKTARESRIVVSCHEGADPSRVASPAARGLLSFIALHQSSTVTSRRLRSDRPQHRCVARALRCDKLTRHRTPMRPASRSAWPAQLDFTVGGNMSDPRRSA